MQDVARHCDEDAGIGLARQLGERGHRSTGLKEQRQDDIAEVLPLELTCGKTLGEGSGLEDEEVELLIKGHEDLARMGDMACSSEPAAHLEHGHPGFVEQLDAVGLAELTP